MDKHAVLREAQYAACVSGTGFIRIQMEDGEIKLTSPNPVNIWQEEDDELSRDIR